MEVNREHKRVDGQNLFWHEKLWQMNIVQPVIVANNDNYDKSAIFGPNIESTHWRLTVHTEGCYSPDRV